MLLNTLESVLFTDLLYITHRVAFAFDQLVVDQLVADLVLTELKRGESTSRDRERERSETNEKIFDGQLSHLVEFGEIRVHRSSVLKMKLSERDEREISSLTTSASILHRVICSIFS